MELPNLTYINELSGNDDSFKEKIIAIIKNELPEEIKNYQNAIKNNDYVVTAGIVHKLKHKISIFGLEKSYYIAKEFEDNLKSESTDLQPEFEEILNKMQNFLYNL